MAQDSLSLSDNQELTLSYPANGRTITLLMEESPGYPAESHPAISLEGCGVITNHSFSTGFSNMFGRQEEEPWISKSCIENHNYPSSDRIIEKPRGYGYHHFIEEGSRNFEFCIKLDQAVPANIESLNLELILSPQFLPGTFQPIAWNHPISWKATGNDRILIEFQEAELYRQEAFYIRFRMRLKADAELGSFIAIEGNAYYNGTVASPIYLAFFNLNSGETLYEPVLSPDPLIQNLSVMGRANAADYFSDLAVDNLGNVFVSGTTFSFGEKRHLYLGKHSPQGLLLWEKTYQLATPSMSPSKVLALPDQSILLLGNFQDPESPSFYRESAYCFALKIDAATGEEIWTKSWKPGPSQLGGDIFEAIVRVNGQILLFGISRNNGSASWKNFLIEMDSDGQFIWQQFFNSGSSGVHYYAQIREAIDGQILLGLQPVAGDDNFDYMIRKFSHSGDPQGQFEFSETEMPAYITHFELAPEGGVYLIGLSSIPIDQGYEYPFYLAKLNAALEKEWSTASEDMANLWVEGMAFKNNHFYIAGESLADSANIVFDLALIKVDTQGHIHWRKKLDFNSAERNARLAATDEGKFWIAAQSTVANLLYDQQIILIAEADSLINSISQLPPPVSLLIHPNPATDGLYYQLPEGAQSHDIYWEILDQAGKRIRSGRHNEPHSIPVQKLISGLYLLRLVVDEKLYLGNFIKH
ncbi:MAG: T9SS type A sorting domain-containing protein [Lewinellaceae bacterium]|nr:T9SS type A sorting domain-containing protein [Lewinellaceae bacterium]